MTKMIVFAIAAALAAAAPAEIYERDTPFNGGTITSAAPGALDPADTHPGLNLIPWPKAPRPSFRPSASRTGRWPFPSSSSKTGPTRTTAR